MPNHRYQGDELTIFAHAHNWKRYWISQLAPFVKGDVLEIGAGIGSNTRKLRYLSTGQWLCLEPDELLVTELRGRVATNLSSPVEVVCGTVNSLPEGKLFDTALYIDVLEHIANDVAEIAAVARHIRSGGHIIVLSPAHQILYSPFDRAIGHQRRYNRASLRRCTPPSGRSIMMRYLDSAGYFLSLANRIVLHQASPTLQQIRFWDHYILPFSQLIDPWVGFRFGKSILGVWQVDGEPTI
jgi:2-polyprenyl-3-methyl-5-hydroxy-6-metoxy-1,4-benzoquinol methylase